MGPISSILITSAQATPPTLAEGWAASEALEAEGAHDAATEALRPFLEAYPQDYALAMRVGWLAYRAGRLGLAEEAYRRAVVLSGGSLEAVLGLAWVLIGQGALSEARAQLASLDAGADGVAEALAAARPLGSVYAAAWLTVLPPDLGPTLATTLRAGGGRAWPRSSLGGDVVLVAYTGTASTEEGSPPASLRAAPGPGAGQGPGAGPGPGAGTGAGPGQGPPGQTGTDPTTPGPSGGPWSSLSPSAGLDLEAWGHAGTGGPSGGIEVVGAVLLQTAAEVAPGGVIGAIGRVSPAGDLRLEASLTQPRGGTPAVVRLAPSWWIPAGWLALEPAGAVQHTSGQWRGSAGATVWAVPGPWGAWVGGRLGSSRTITSLALRSAAAWPALERAGAWAGLRIGSIDATWGSLGWSATWLDADGTGLAAARPAHTLAFTLTTSP